MKSSFWLASLFLMICLTAHVCPVAAQRFNLRIGEWENIMPYQIATAVIYSDAYYYFSTGYSILQLNPTDNSWQTIARAQGLSNARIKQLAFYKPGRILMIFYTDGSFDLWSERDHATEFITDIRDNQQIVGGKAVTHAAFFGSMAFLSTPFGLLGFDMQERVFRFGLHLQSAVVASTVYGDSLYIATAQGVRRAPINAGVNLQDISNWPLLTSSDGFPTGQASGLCVFNDDLILVINKMVYRYNGQQVQLIHTPELGYQADFVTAYGPSLLIGEQCQPVNCFNDRVLRYNAQGQISPAGSSNCSNFLLNAVETPDGRILFADEEFPMRFTGNNGFDCNLWNFNSPGTPRAWRIAVSQSGDLAVASGGLNDAFTGLSRGDGLFVWQNESWKTYDYRTPPLIDSFAHLDFLSATFEARDGSLWAGTYWGGLVHIKDGNVVNIYNQTNSALQVDQGDIQRARVMDVVFDAAGNLWMANRNTSRPIVVRQANGTWRSYTSPLNILTRVAIDRTGNKWFVNSGGSPGLVVFNDNNTLDNTADDTYRQFSTNNSALNAAPICLAADRDGLVWVGTRDGAVRFSCDNNLQQCVSDAPIVELDGINAVLLDDQEVRAVAVDAANRKWFGTTAGVYVLSADSRTQVANFNTSNSPLPANDITDIAFDNRNGFAYIGTSNGIAVLRTEAVDGGLTHKLNAYAYPNPVQPNYEGPIAIIGLAQDADVRITDTAGQLIWRGRAFGGQAVWDGRDYTGRRASSGVYLVFSTANNAFGSPDTLVTKIIVIQGQE